MAIPENVKTMLKDVGVGWGVLLEMNGTAEELMDEYDLQDPGERIIKEELLSWEPNMLGHQKVWFDDDKFDKMVDDDRSADLHHVLAALANMDAGLELAARECGAWGVENEFLWSPEFLKWKEDAAEAARARHCAHVGLFKMMVRWKLRAIRVRKSAWAPDGEQVARLAKRQRWQ